MYLWFDCWIVDRLLQLHIASFSFLEFGTFIFIKAKAIKPINF